MKHVFIFAIRLYQIFISPAIGGRARCRFFPRCSDYSIEVFRNFGIIKGMWLTAKRLARCNPLCEGGLDLPPAKINENSSAKNFPLEKI
ncbi:MAG: membrane protein insertion efficiency factor YidD [Rickettsiales bacterium]|jgi:putative membrane protein insertion efficiency factor|nr:membrane protein insertion efficiency factor YidD [Rickettsiales bacterium]